MRQKQAFILQAEHGNVSFIHRLLKITKVAHHIIKGALCNFLRDYKDAETGLSIQGIAMTMIINI